MISQSRCTSVITYLQVLNRSCVNDDADVSIFGGPSFFDERCDLERNLISVKGNKTGYIRLLNGSFLDDL